MTRDICTTLLCGGPLDGMVEDVPIDEITEFNFYDRMTYYTNQGLTVDDIPFRPDIDFDDPTPGIWQYRISKSRITALGSTSVYRWVAVPQSTE